MSEETTPIKQGISCNPNGRSHKPNRKTLSPSMSKGFTDSPTENPTKPSGQRTSLDERGVHDIQEGSEPAAEGTNATESAQGHTALQRVTFNIAIRKDNNSSFAKKPTKPVWTWRRMMQLQKHGTQSDIPVQAVEEEGRASRSSGEKRGKSGRNKEERVDSWRSHQLLGGTTMDRGNDGSSKLDLDYISDSLQTD
ncbi:hypothetical protein CHS0354_017417 [Potamilus streckersoni]|uniref:Uncharacterized protein n=1 Tax=Potamilus streckersoni TaxID=2493646 RepID=A0AAE0WAX7_9BIVA|nr:hypothetical protein CHS0354_017417 [Potamilus streckersoni]